MRRLTSLRVLRLATTLAWRLCLTQTLRKAETWFTDTVVLPRAPTVVRQLKQSYRIVLWVPEVGWETLQLQESVTLPTPLSEWTRLEILLCRW